MTAKSLNFIRCLGNLTEARSAPLVRWRKHSNPKRAEAAKDRNSCPYKRWCCLIVFTILKSVRLGTDPELFYTRSSTNTS